MKTVPGGGKQCGKAIALPISAWNGCVKQRHEEKVHTDNLRQKKQKDGEMKVERL